MKKREDPFSKLNKPDDDEKEAWGPYSNLSMKN